MKKFMAMYMAPAATIRQTMKATPEQMKAGMDKWNKWAKKYEKVILDLGAPLGKTKRMAAKGMSDTRNAITGYSIVQGTSVASVGKIFKNHPHFQLKGASIDLIEFFKMPGV